MGDRRQIYFKDINVYFYTHWGGGTLLEELQEAVKSAKDRWTDEPYCLRIIMTKMFNPYSDSTTGCGIWNSDMETQYEINPIVSVKDRTIVLDTESFTFEEFVKIKDVSKYNR